MDQQKVLHEPFNIDTHKKAFVNYLEVLISEEGKVMYAVPSHQQKLISIACKKLGITRQEVSDLCPPEYYFDYNHWLCIITGYVSLWNDFMIGIPNEKQKEAILELMQAGLYYGKILK